MNRFPTKSVVVLVLGALLLAGCSYPIPIHQPALVMAEAPDVPLQADLGALLVIAARWAGAVAAVANLLKSWGWLKDGRAPAFSLAANFVIVGVLTVGVIRMWPEGRTLEIGDGVAMALTAFLQLVVQVIGTWAVHEGLKRAHVPGIGFAYRYRLPSAPLVSPQVARH